MPTVPKSLRRGIDPSRTLAWFKSLIRVETGTSDNRQGRPDFPALLFQRQYKRNPFRCQPITVAGLTITSAPRHHHQNRENITQSARSKLPKLGRFLRRVAAAS